jgi:hypothetical protein
MILTKDDLTREELYISEWGGSVYVRVMTGGERDTLESRQLATEGQAQSERLKNLRSLLAALTVCDESGAAIFMIDDMAALSNKSSTALDKIFEVSMRLNRLRAEEVEELVGELKNDQSADSGLDSPSSSE